MISTSRRNLLKGIAAGFGLAVAIRIPFVSSLVFDENEAVIEILDSNGFVLGRQIAARDNSGNGELFSTVFPAGYGTGCISQMNLILPKHSRWLAYTDRVRHKEFHMVFKGNADTLKVTYNIWES